MGKIENTIEFSKSQMLRIHRWLRTLGIQEGVGRMASIGVPTQVQGVKLKISALMNSFLVIHKGLLELKESNRVVPVRVEKAGLKEKCVGIADGSTVKPSS